MKISPVRGLLLLGALCACSFTATAQVIQLRATLNAAQEVPASTSPATGSAIMLYDIGANTFDLVVTINGMTNTATASHIHEAPAGQNGGVVTNLGAEAVYTRSGTTLRATFRNVTHGGDKLKLLQGGAYYNIHSAQFPGGEIRGQLIAQPVRMIANLDTAQEQAAFPAVNLSAVNNFGGAILTYDPVANTVSLRHSLFNFNNPFTNSHIHEGAPGVSGPVRVNLGNNANAGAYSSANGYIAGAHDAVPFVGDPLVLLAGGMYLNYHSQTFAGGQLRGQLTVSNETATTRFQNLSSRGFVGTAGQELIAGLVVTGSEPVRTLITAKGPSLAAFGVTGALANPRLTLFDSAGRQIAQNDDVGAIAAGTELARIPGVPTNTVESALVVVLPPGLYTAVVSSTSGTGVALVESYDLRSVSASAAITALPSPSPVKASSLAAARAAVEICAAPIAVAVK
jgi:hypothetical protein